MECERCGDEFPGGGAECGRCEHIHDLEQKISELLGENERLKAENENRKADQLSLIDQLGEIDNALGLGEPKDTQRCAVCNCSYTAGQHLSHTFIDKRTVPAIERLNDTIRDLQGSLARSDSENVQLKLLISEKDMKISGCLKVCKGYREDYQEACAEIKKLRGESEVE